jgi:hypothetical protein
MSKKMQSTEGGFILEGEVPHVSMGEVAASCAVRTGSERDENEALHQSLLVALNRFGGQRVRITVEVVRHSPTDRLRDLIERFREESEEQPSRRATGV